MLWLFVCFFCCKIATLLVDEKTDGKGNGYKILDPKNSASSGKSKMLLIVKLIFLSFYTLEKYIKGANSQYFFSRSTYERCPPNKGYLNVGN